MRRLVIGFFILAELAFSFLFAFIVGDFRSAYYAGLISIGLLALAVLANATKKLARQVA